MNRPADYIKFITVILLSVSINLPVFITHHYLEYQRKTIRKEVKTTINAGLQDDQLTILRFKKSELANSITWEKSDEFEFEGKLYDVVKVLVKPDSIIYFCWLDNEESKVKQLLNNISNIEWTKNKNRENQKNREINYVKNLICPSIYVCDNNLKLVKIGSKSYSYQVLHYKNNNSLVECPPPEQYI